MMTLQQIRVKQVFTQVLNECTKLNNEASVLLASAQEGTIQVPKARRLLDPIMRRACKMQNLATRIREYYSDWSDQDWFESLIAIQSTEKVRYYILVDLIG